LQDGVQVGFHYLNKKKGKRKKKRGLPSKIFKVWGELKGKTWRKITEM